VSSSPAQLDTVGRYYALRRRPEIGLNFSLRALHIEPGKADAWDTLALLYFHAGRVKDAVAAERRAIGLTSEYRRGVPEKFRERLRHFERAASRIPAR
jgi:tetratricopeptide (TPR) repeat protein